MYRYLFNKKNSMNYVSNKNEQLTICNNQTLKSINIYFIFHKDFQKQHEQQKRQQIHQPLPEGNFQCYHQNSVVCVFISGTSSGAWVEDLIGNILSGKSSCSSGKSGIKSLIACEESCVGIVAAAA